MIGQGVNQETLQMSQLPHYSVGGALHIVINNQVSSYKKNEKVPY